MDILEKGFASIRVGKTDSPCCSTTPSVLVSISVCAMAVGLQFRTTKQQSSRRIYGRKIDFKLEYGGMGGLLSVAVRLFDPVSPSRPAGGGEMRLRI